MNIRTDTKNCSSAIAEKRRHIREKHNPGRISGCIAADIKNVLVINSASRSGSSFLHSVLSEHPDVISLNGEDVVFHKLHGIGTANTPDDSDCLHPDIRPDDPVLKNIACDILDDAGCLQTGKNPFSREAYLTDCIQRFILQWPKIQADPGMLYPCAARMLEQDMQMHSEFVPARFWNSFLACLAGQGVAVNPYYYDMPSELIRETFPSLQPSPEPPFDGGCIEEPPFVVPAPRTFPSNTEIGKKTLLLKSSSNCYRIGFIKKLFPAARFRFILLARNPMASINGMMDGWLSHGFFSHDLGSITRLGINGYSMPEKPWTLRWWKFDLPPGWAGYTDKPLEEVCAFQWQSANDRILKDSDNGVFEKKLSLRYEDILSPSSLSHEINRIFDFAGLAYSDIAGGAAPARHVMSITAPQPHKWLRHRHRLMPLCSGAVEATAARLGYNPKEAEKWP
ncbi:MAG: sulfotransferase [bacterium]